MSVANVQPQAPTVLQHVVVGNWPRGHVAQPIFVQGQSSGLSQQLMPSVIAGVSSGASIPISDAQDDEMDLVGQVWPNTNCTKDLVVDDIVIYVQFDLVVEPRDHGDFL